MFNYDSEKKPIRRGSCFIKSPILNISKPKKTVFTKPLTEDFSEFHFQRYREPRTGDSNENIPIQGESSGINEINYGAKMSKTVLVDKKMILKSPGHFTKLKKKHQEDLNKFLDQKSKSFELSHLKATIEKIQAKIDELSKEIKSRSLPKVQEFFEKVETVEEIYKIKLDKREVLNALSFAFAIIVTFLIALFLVEGEFFFNSVLFPGSFKLPSKFKEDKSCLLDFLWG